MGHYGRNEFIHNGLMDLRHDEALFKRKLSTNWSCFQSVMYKTKVNKVYESKKIKS